MVFDKLTKQQEVKDETPKQSTASVTTPAPSAPVGNDRLTQFKKVCAAGEAVFIDRNAQYGDAIKATGVLGASVELIGTSARLRQLVLKSGDGGESNKKDLVEVFKDLHNYANIALMMLAENNWTGE